MAVQKSRKSRSRRGKRNSHAALTGPTLSIESNTGETHRRHHVSARGYYRGRQVIIIKEKTKAEPAANQG